MRIFGTLVPVPSDLALDVAAAVGKNVIRKHGTNSTGIIIFIYQYIEDTYAISIFALRLINTENFTFHDTPPDVTSPLASTMPASTIPVPPTRIG
jgi:arsenite oxidase large subunit